MISKNKLTKPEETSDWPRLFSQTLGPNEQKKIKKILPQLKRAQIFLWRALNIYDDFLDGEGERAELPRANNYYRRFCEIHYRLNLSADYYKLFNHLMDNLDKANREEVVASKLKIKNSRVFLPKKLVPQKNLVSLAHKSLALALGSLALLFALDYKKSDKKTKATLNFFKYALAAKQLADDSHDWLEDLRNGLVTRATWPILHAAKNKRIKIYLNEPPTQTYLLFAESASPLIIKDLEHLCGRARKEMFKFTKDPKSPLLNKLVLPLERACAEANNFRALMVKNC